MSFNLQPIRQPLIQGSQSMKNDGSSAGNLGYMQQGKKKKDEDSKDNEINTNYLEKDEPDILQLEFDDGTKKKTVEKSEKKEPKKSWINNIIDKFSDKTPKSNNPFENAIP